MPASDTQSKPHRRVTALFAVVVAASGWALGCGDRITLLVCGPDEVPSGDRCIPAPADGGTPDANSDEGAGGADSAETRPDTGAGDPGGQGDSTPVDGGGDGATDPGPAADTAEPTPDALTPHGGIGSPCQRGSDCDHGTCLDWQGGYCTRLDCHESACPIGSVCVPLTGGNFGCLTPCTGEGDCRAGGGQACKTIEGMERDEFVSVCYGLDDDAGPVGSACGDDSDCTGSGLCLTPMPGGYCSRTPCTVGSCEAGAACVKLDGQPMCLRTCDADSECLVGAEGFDRACAPLKDLDKEPVDVCVSGLSGQDIGAPCSSGFECASARCEILGDGRCAQSGYPCFDEGDCSGAEFCSVNPESRVGVCNQECSVASQCPGSTFCVGGPGAAVGFCRSPCAGVGDVEACDPADGFACTYGYALGDTAGGGRNLCERSAGRGLGASCEGDGHCDSGLCRQAVSGEAAMCVEPCGAGQYCPFPGTCAIADATTVECRKACFSPADCPVGFACEAPFGSSRKVCL